MVWVSSRVGSSLFSGIVLSLIVNARIASSQQVIPGSYIVEFEDSDESPDTLFSTLAKSSISVSRRLDLSHSLFNGASFQINDVENERSTLDTISSLKNVKSVSPNRVYKIPKDQTWSVGDGVSTEARPSRKPSDRPYAPHVMTGVDKLHEAGYSGKGINIAIIDSGVDYNHPDLGGCFGEGCKISYGYDLVGDDFFSEGVPGLPQPDDDPYDNCHGHGTHVAGIIASEINEWGFGGVAPNATLGMYRALGCSDVTTDDVLIKAYLMAYEAGADIISMSIGILGGWSEGVAGTAIRRIVEAGVPCSVSIGNDGVLGAFSTDSPGDSRGATGVASFQNEDLPIRLFDGTYEVNGSAANPFGWTPGAPPKFPNGTYPLFAISFNTNAPDDACETLGDDIPDLSEYLVLVRESTTCGSFFQMSNLESKGAKFIMLYSNSAGTRAVNYPESFQGVGMTTREQADEWIKLLAKGLNVSVKITDPTSLKERYEAVKNTDTGGYLSYFTSWGPTFDLEFKPQFGAPGGQILSSWPLDLGGYAVKEGTSMACPYVAGAMALLLEARGKTDPATLNNILAATAKPNLYFDSKNTQPYLAPVIQQGAGLINVFDALHTETILSVPSISFNDTEHFKQGNFSIQNTGKETVTYDLGNSGSLAVYTIEGTGTPVPYPYGSGVSPEIVGDVTELEFSSKRVMVPAGESAVVTVAPTLLKDLSQERTPVYGGFVNINGTNGDSLSIPYMGVASAMYNATILNTYLDLVYLGSSNGRIGPDYVFHLPPPNSTIDSANDTNIYPTLWTGLGLGTSVLRADIKPVPGFDHIETVNVLGDDVVGSVNLYPRYLAARTFNAGQDWDGLMDDGKYVPRGNYTIVVRALKIFGDSENPDDYERVETEVFGIRYQNQP